MILVRPVPGPADNPSREGRAGDSTTLVYPPWKHNYGFNRFRQFHLTAYGGHGRKISSPQGIAAVKLHQTDEEGPGDDDELTVFGVNAGRGELIYNRSLFELGSYDGAVGGTRLADPVGIAADADGVVAVADRGNNRVIVFELDDDLALKPRRVITLEETGVALDSPSGVALESGYLYVTDSGNDRVVVLDTAGEVVAQMTDSTGALDDPFGIAVINDPEWNRYGSRFMVVTGAGNQRLTQQSLSGYTVGSVSYGEISDKAGGFYYVAVDYFSNVYVTDDATGCVYKFDRNLRYLTRFECGVGDGGKLDRPRGIAVYRRFGQVFIAENTGVSYYWIGTDVSNLSCRGESTWSGLELTVRFFLTEHSRVTVELAAKRAKISEMLADQVITEPGNVRRRYKVPADLLPDNVAECELFVRVKAKPVYSSENYLEVERESEVRWPARAGGSGHQND